MGQQATHTLGLRSLVKFARENVPLFARLLARGLQTPRIWMSKHQTRSHRARKVIHKHRDVPREIRARIFSHAILRATHTEGKKTPSRARDDKTQPRDHRIHPAPRAMRRVLFRPRETTTGLKIRRREFKGKEERERTHHDGTSFLRVCVQRSFCVLYKLRSPFL